MFIPTGSYLLMKNIHNYIPNCHFILADFDFLPDVSIPGINAPIVTTKGELPHEKEDFNSITDSKGNVDILFPTDFRLLR